MNEDVSEVLDGTVDEVKDRIEDLDKPDFKAILEAEKENDSRKTLIEWLERKIDNEEVEVAPNEEESETEEVEEESSGGKRSPLQMAAIGAAIGIIIGLGAGIYLGTMEEADTAAADANLQEFMETSDFAGSYQIDGPERANGMFYYTLTIEQETENGTQTQEQGAYVSTDGELLFLEVEQSPFAPPNPIRLDEAIQRQQAEQDQGNETVPGQ